METKTTIDDFSKEKHLLNIAKENFFVETLETRNSDSLDFYNCNVGSIKNALEDAYDLAVFKTIVSTCLIIAKASKYNSFADLYYICPKSHRPAHLRSYLNLDELKKDAQRFVFNFSYNPEDFK